MARSRVRAAALAVVAGASMAVPAYADDHRPPRTTLRLTAGIQQGAVYHADGWVRETRDGKGCVVTFAHGFPRFDKALRHAPGEEIVVRLHKAAPPVEVEVQRWPGADRSGAPRGEPAPLPWALRPHLVDGEVRAWDVIIAPAVAPGGHLYLGVGAYWQNDGRCTAQPDLGSQYAAWTFHIRS